MKDKKLIPNKWLNKFKSAITKNEKINPKDNDRNIIFLILRLFLKILLNTSFMYPEKLAHKEIRKNIQKISLIFNFLYKY